MVRFTCLVLFISSCIFVSSAYPLNPNNLGESAHESHVTNLERRSFRQCFERLAKLYADRKGVINAAGTATAITLESLRSVRDYAVTYKANIDASEALNEKMKKGPSDKSDDSDDRARLEACERKLKEVTEEWEKEKKSKALHNDSTGGQVSKSTKRIGHGLFPDIESIYKSAPVNPLFKNGVPAPKSIMPYSPAYTIFALRMKGLDSTHETPKSGS